MNIVHYPNKPLCPFISVSQLFNRWLNSLFVQYSVMYIIVLIMNRARIIILVKSNKFEVQQINLLTYRRCVHYICYIMSNCIDMETLQIYMTCEIKQIRGSTNKLIDISQVCTLHMLYYEKLY